MPVTVIILNWNSEDTLACLSRQNTRPNYVLVVNNNPYKKINKLKRHWSSFDLVIENLGGNKGFAAANNISASLSASSVINWLKMSSDGAARTAKWIIDENSR